MMDKQRLKKFGLLGSLYVSQYIPAMFLFEALPVFMRQQGMTLDVIGLLPLLALPLTFSFLWSPVIDRYGFTRWGHYRFWIICFQFLVAVVTIACAWLDIQENFNALLISMVLLFLFSASQDIATDALAVGLLDTQERGLGNGIQRGGGMLGSIIGGGVMLLLLSAWGWKATLLTMAGIMVVALVPLWYHQERDTHQPRNELPEARMMPARLVLFKFLNSLMDLIRFYRRPGVGAWVSILVLSSSGSFMASTMFRPLLVDVGLSLTEIGILQGIVSYSVGIVAAIVTGFWIAPLGRKRSLLLFGAFEVVAIAAFLLPALGVTALPVLYLVAIGSQIAFSMTSTTMFTIMMDNSQKETAGTDFTMQAALIYLSGLAASALSGILAEAIGYAGVFLLSVALSLLSIALIAKVFPNDRLVPAKPCSD